MSVIKYSSPSKKVYYWSKFKELLHLLLREWNTAIVTPLEQHWPWYMLQGSREKKVMCRWFEWVPWRAVEKHRRKFWGNESRDRGVSFENGGVGGNSNHLFSIPYIQTHLLVIAMTVFVENCMRYIFFFNQRMQLVN